MEKIELGTPDGAVENIEKIAELFPQVVTEVENTDGELARAVDFDALRDLLGDVAEGQRERYQFTWPGKREAKAEARRPIYKTMIPEPGKSKDWDTTENLYIEGDNLDALKILKETYAGKVKLIYIDPPYNTGHDFVYDDDFAKTRGEYNAESGDYDEEGGRLVANTEGNGRFHSDWCSMIYPRLTLARDLLAADGTIFISIDENEANNLEKICDEVFGRANFLTRFIWRKVDSPNDNHVVITPDHEYIFPIAKMRQRLPCVSVGHLSSLMPTMGRTKTADIGATGFSARTEKTAFAPTGQPCITRLRHRTARRFGLFGRTGAKAAGPLGPAASKKSMLAEI